MDETYIRVRGRWVYPYRAVDTDGRTEDFFLSRNRDVNAAKSFLRKAMQNRHKPTKITLDAFYEKVVKVKADVAAILKFFFPDAADRGRPSRRRPGSTDRGDAQGGFQRSALKPLLRGEPRHRCVPALFAGTQRASSVGGTRPPRLSPGGGNGKGGVQTSVPPQAVRVAVVRMPGTPLVYCVLALLPRFSPLTITKPTGRSARTAFPKSCWRHPLLCRASIRTLHGPHWARCKLGSDLKPRSITQ